MAPRRLSSCVSPLVIGKDNRLLLRKQESKSLLFAAAIIARHSHIPRVPCLIAASILSHCGAGFLPATMTLIRFQRPRSISSARRPFCYFPRRTKLIVEYITARRRWRRGAGKAFIHLLSFSNSWKLGSKTGY